ncbi:hypothetical protein [Bradyrhizobium liaoningense]|uniref:hypothetical protein n=1 Tax=Bradyrhizobium liaoningense TaxID=43992 RepID=UPI001BAA046E|nr:hypothetical protein [Bradyrhizobium liaoningense]MBR0719513.1 hypothetical protein [Bradyrhizobium liaoningense]
MTSLQKPGRGWIAPLIAVSAAVLLTGAVARAQNLDAEKPPAKLFADACASCHRNPRGLAKGRFTLTLAWFLRDHYTSGPDSAKALASYLVSVDSPAAKPRAAAKSGKPAGPSRSPRPPAPVTGR